MDSPPEQQSQIRRTTRRRSATSSRAAWRLSTAGSTRRPTGTGGSSAGRCATGCGRGDHRQGLEYTRTAIDIVRLARALPEVQYTYTGIGGALGGGGLVTDKDSYVRLVPRADRDRSQQEIDAILRAEVKP